MGDKSAAKRLMEKARVPLVPGYHGENQDAAFLEKESARIGFPVLIKPSAGGGGKGMRIVRDQKSFSENLEGAKREAKSSFGDDRVLIERYLERPRHIEMQVFGDSHGNVVHLFERDCSVQRRHQKVLEEAPAPGFGKRDEMARAAVAAAKAIGYRGAGTVEFIAEQDGRFYFMEMNTRLQVEHPVTEMITGLDLVEWQLRVASGEKIPLAQKEIRSSGHAIEARIYAEDPRRDFLPATGRLLHLAFPQESGEVRIDTGVEQGGEITPWFDPMIAKLVVHGSDRAAALERLRAALDGVEIMGVTTNVEFLRKVAASRAFSSAELDTGLIERNRSELVPAVDLAPFLAAAAQAELGHEEAEAKRLAAASGDPYSPCHRRLAAQLRSAPRLRLCGGWRRALGTRSLGRRATGKGEQDPRHSRWQRLACALRRHLPTPLAQVRARRCGHGSRRVVDGADAGAHRQGHDQGGRESRQGRRPPDPGGDEDGAHHYRAEGRHREGNPLCAGRAGTGGCGIGDARVNTVRIVEMGPRDGLQNEPHEVPTAVKVELIERLADAGLPAV
jgi:3-methylcrotonyl-CoA carboxylase alpha subunit